MLVACSRDLEEAGGQEEVRSRTLYVEFGLAGNDAYPSTRISYEGFVCRIERRNNIKFKFEKGRSEKATYCRSSSSPTNKQATRRPNTNHDHGDFRPTEPIIVGARPTTDGDDPSNSLHA